MRGRGEERGPGANVGADNVRVLEAEHVSDAHHELAHRPGDISASRRSE